MVPKLAPTRVRWWRHPPTERPVAGNDRPSLSRPRGSL